LSTSSPSEPEINIFDILDMGKNFFVYREDEFKDLSNKSIDIIPVDYIFKNNLSLLYIPDLSE